MIRYQKHKRGLRLFKYFRFLLFPLAILFAFLVMIRRGCYKMGIFRSYQMEVPVIIVGNILMGGSGKTPLVIYLANLLQTMGFKPAIVTRGYKSEVPYTPYLVTNDSSAKVVGDEPMVLYRHVSCPVVIDHNRVRAIRQIRDHFPCNIILCDDGLQHYKLKRDIEIIVHDQKADGCKHYFPVGRLREGRRRLRGVDLVIEREGRGTKYFKITPIRFINLKDENCILDLDAFAYQRVHAVAGVGDPSRFFATLARLSMDVYAHPLPDHAEIQKKHIQFKDNLSVIMTEKDAVKCFSFAHDNCWYLEAKTEVSEPFLQSFQEQVAAFNSA